jgi:hypothetical protein
VASLGPTSHGSYASGSAPEGSSYNLSLLDDDNTKDLTDVSLRDPESDSIYTLDNHEDTESLAPLVLPGPERWDVESLFETREHLADQSLRKRAKSCATSNACRHTLAATMTVVVVGGTVVEHGKRGQKYSSLNRMTLNRISIYIRPSNRSQRAAL